MSLQCIEEWLWRKQSCPTCHVQVCVPQSLYWSSSRVKVPWDRLSSNGSSGFITDICYPSYEPWLQLSCDDRLLPGESFSTTTGLWEWSMSVPVYWAGWGFTARPTSSLQFSRLPSNQTTGLHGPGFTSEIIFRCYHWFLKILQWRTLQINQWLKLTMSWWSNQFLPGVETRGFSKFFFSWRSTQN